MESSRQKKLDEIEEARERLRSHEEGRPEKDSPDYSVWLVGLEAIKAKLTRLGRSL